MVAVPSSAATRRMDNAASPSASATSIAVATTRDRLSACSDTAGGPECGDGDGDSDGSIGTGDGSIGAGSPPGRPDPTTVPMPGTACTRPWRRSAVSTLVAVAMATPHFPDDLPRRRHPITAGKLAGPDPPG